VKNNKDYAAQFLNNVKFNDEIVLNVILDENIKMNEKKHK